MEAGEWDETVDLDPQRFVALHFRRRWPAYTVEWSLKQRVGESDFPLASGAREEVPADGENADGIWQRLKESAIRDAHQAADSSAPAESQHARSSSWLSRLLRRD